MTQTRLNAAFIAAARTDVPALIAEVRRLRGEIDDLEAENARLSGDLSFAAPPSPSAAEMRKVALTDEFAELIYQGAIHYLEAPNNALSEDADEDVDLYEELHLAIRHAIRALAEKEKP